MQISQEARDARKQQQIARIEAKQRAKDDPEFDYSDWYNSQPAQQERIKLNAAVTDARRAVKAAQKAVELAVVSGTDVASAETAVGQAQLQLAALVQTKQARKDIGKGGVAVSGGAV
jgi:outer membrane protein TolC